METSRGLQSGIFRNKYQLSLFYINTSENKDYFLLSLSYNTGNHICKIRGYLCYIPKLK